MVAELCGHESVGDTGAVKFIEASWVGTPAFQGAVLRNILALEDTGRAESEIRRMLASPAPSAYWSDTAMKKAANFTQLAFGDDEGDAPPEETAAPTAPSAPFQDLEDSVYKSISDRVRQRIQKDLEPKKADPPPADWSNDTIIKESAAETAPLAVTPRVQVASTETYKRAMLAACHAASSDAALVNAAAEINAAFGLQVDPALYRVALSVGPILDPASYVAACKKCAKRELSRSDLRIMVRIGTLLTQWASRNQPRKSPPQE